MTFLLNYKFLRLSCFKKIGVTGQTDRHRQTDEQMGWVGTALRASFSFLTDRLSYLLINQLRQVAFPVSITISQKASNRNCPVNDNHRLHNWRSSAI